MDCRAFPTRTPGVEEQVDQGGVAVVQGVIARLRVHLGPPFSDDAIGGRCHLRPRRKTALDIATMFTHFFAKISAVN